MTKCEGFNMTKGEGFSIAMYCFLNFIQDGSEQSEESDLKYSVLNYFTIINIFKYHLI